VELAKYFAPELGVVPGYAKYEKEFATNLQKEYGDLQTASTATLLSVLARTEEYILPIREAAQHFGQPGIRVTNSMLRDLDAAGVLISTIWAIIQHRQKTAVL
jgi:hypothetical protein